jgi:predicted ABC-type ATPase
MARPTQKTIVMIAGPNGAGKTTFATEYLPKELGVMNFINADLIAAVCRRSIPKRRRSRQAESCRAKSKDFCPAARISRSKRH